MGNESAGTSGGFGRRDLLKRSAIAGGLVWASPMLLSSVAGATPPACPQGSCPTYHRVKLQTEDKAVPLNGDKITCPGIFEDAGSGGQGLFCLDQLQVPDGETLVATTCAQFNSHVTKVENIGPGNSVRITLAPGYQFVGTFSKKGTGCIAAPVTNNCRTAEFQESSHLEFLYCGPN